MFINFKKTLLKPPLQKKKKKKSEILKILDLAKIVKFDYY